MGLSSALCLAGYWMAALCKLHKDGTQENPRRDKCRSSGCQEWRELCDRDPKANISMSFNRVYEYVPGLVRLR